jgi:hypothetical protein
MFKSRGTHDHIFLSQIRDSLNLKVRVLLFISPRNWVAQLYAPELCSLSGAFYDSQGYVGVIRTLFHTGYDWRFTDVFLYSADTNRAVKTAA